jgi:hypothetical protein
MRRRRVEGGRSGSKQVEVRRAVFDWLRLASTAFVLFAPALPAQTMREYTASRPYHGEQRMSVKLEFAAGELRLMPAAPGTLYRMESRYDSERYAPRSEFHAPSRELELGLKSEGKGGIRVTNSKQLDQQATVWLSPEVELGLALSLGASESRIDLGGLRLRDLRLEVGGSRTRLSFSRPGVGSCREAVVEVGAGELEVDRFANSGCSKLRLNGGVGVVVLDMGGQPEGDVSAEVTMTMGRLTLKLPKDAGVRMTLDRFFASFSPAGFTRQGEQFVTPDYQAARRKIDLRVASSVGAVKVEWY